MHINLKRSELQTIRHALEVSAEHFADNATYCLANGQPRLAEQFEIRRADNMVLLQYLEQFE